jgi:hypothetical protein
MKGRSIRCLLIVVMILAAGCAAQSKRPPAPEVTLVQLSEVPDLRLNVVSGLPMHYRLKIVNPFDYAITLVMVEVESVGDSGAYGMKRVRHAFNRTIPAKSADAVDFRAWIHRLQIDIKGETSSPVMIRGSARFEGPAGVMRRNFVARAQ